MTEGKLQWHVAFAATLKIEKNIGRIFRTYNIIEYKSPDDYLSINDFYKVYGYTCFYQSDTETVGAIAPEELTITFVCYHYPRKMLKHIQDVRNISVVKKESGIYELVGDPFIIQVIVVKELEKETNYWLQALRNNLKSGGEVRELVERYERNKNQPDYQAVMDVVTRANWAEFEEEREMCDALRELFAKEFQEERERGEAEGKEIGKQETAINLKKMGMAIEDISRAVGVGIDIVQKWLIIADEV